MKTSQLTGNALDWAVAKCESVTVLPKMRGGCYVTLDRGETVLLCYSTDWTQGGAIIEREGIGLHFGDGTWGVAEGVWEASHPECLYVQRGETPLIAAMRCYVANKLGDEVDIE